MALDPRTQVANRAVARTAEIDEGLRSYMLGVYNYMTVGLALTGLVAFFTSRSPMLMNAIYGTPLAWVVMLAPLGIIFFGFRQTMSATAAQITYWVFSALMGLSLAYIFVVYTPASITRVFFVTSATFAGMSLYGYTTKRDLSGIGSFLIMGLWGLIVAMLVNLFMQSAAFDWAISVIGVLIFVGLTAYDTQRIRRSYAEGMGTDEMTRNAVFGALHLYLDFINLFLFLLRLFGNRD